MPNATWGVYWNDLGVIQSERFRESADLDPMPLIGDNSSNTDVFDNGGVILRIEVSFKKVVTSWANAATFVQALLTLINGDQTYPNYPVTYVSDLLGTKLVKFEDMDAPVIVGDGPCQINYTLRLIESSTLG
jgi:hypothetical protein